MKIRFMVTLDVTGGAIDLETVRKNVADGIERQWANAGLSADDDEGCVQSIDVRYQPKA